MEKEVIPDAIVVIGLVGFVMLTVFLVVKTVIAFQEIRYMAKDIENLKKEILKLESEIRSLKYKQQD